MSERRGPSTPARWLFVMVAALVVGWLVLRSPTRRIGDGSEYVAMALQVSELRRPSLSDDEVTTTLAYLKEAGAGFGVYTESFRFPRLRAADGRRDFPHFWFYPALASPGVRLARTLHVHPNAGFALTNLVLFLVALWIVSGVLGWPGSLLLFASPILWWTDKAHTEVFTFSLLAIGLALFEHAPWWTLVALGAASTQNAPIALALPLVLLAAVTRQPALWRDRRFGLGIAAGAALAALHPLYYWSRLGVFEPQTLAGGVRFRFPDAVAAGAFVWDPNLGILPHFPALAVAVIGALIVTGVRRPRALAQPAILLPAALGLLFVVCFAQTTNFNSGGTPGPGRYGLWLIPLAIPLLCCADRHGGRAWRAGLAALAVLSAGWALVVYNPARAEAFLRPTQLAAALWEHAPWIDNPIPEVFVERVTGYDITAVALMPAATASCSKVLLIGGQWPAHCRPAAIPGACAVPGAYCYANRRTDGSYAFWAPAR